MARAAIATDVCPKFMTELISGSAAAQVAVADPLKLLEKYIVFSLRSPANRMLNFFVFSSAEVRVGFSTARGEFCNFILTRFLTIAATLERFLPLLKMEWIGASNIGDALSIGLETGTDLRRVLFSATIGIAPSVIRPF